MVVRVWMALLAVCLCSSALARNEGVTADEIRLGASVVLSGPLGPQTAQYGEGSQLLFDAVNAQGGVHGRMIRYTTLDDGFDPARAVENTRRLLETDKVFMIFHSTGTAQTAAILPLIKEHRTLLFGPVTGASVFRDTFNPLVFHVRAGYASEASRIVSQLRQQGVSRVAVFYPDDGLGKTLLAELRKASEAEKLPFVAEIRLDPKQPDFAAAARQTEKTEAQAVIVATAGATFTDYIKQVQATSARPSFYGFSVASSDAVYRDLGPKARGIILAQIIPSLRNTTIPVVAEYLALLKAKSPQAQPSAAQFDGFVHARLLVEGLRRTGRNLSTESFTKAMEDAGEISFGRFSVRYSPRSHNGSNYVELAIMDVDGNLRY
ncbi:ABC transporter substrate-binding protein [Acidovorax sp. RAC01]|uniref:ABC transporter substrate-binding protein n=1 Tax=Acidovorax sp. RAC01 TaxID=1842533 RepID=UPI00083E857B|nr:ABC transporter substrate-binding protein [Acidovorax sp. RAC01]AOG22384.1 periplasmic binding domain protein [Acidovorax sp. RAC01]